MWSLAEPEKRRTYRPTRARASYACTSMSHAGSIAVSTAATGCIAESPNSPVTLRSTSVLVTGTVSAIRTESTGGLIFDPVSRVAPPANFATSPVETVVVGVGRLVAAALGAGDPTALPAREPAQAAAAAIAPPRRTTFRKRIRPIPLPFVVGDELAARNTIAA